MATAERFLSYQAATALLAFYDVPLAPAQLVHSLGQAVSAALQLGFPVALKAISPQMSHKTDAGLLRLGLSDVGAVQTAAEDLIVRLHSRPYEGLLVQKMISGGLEMVAGVNSDPQFGPVLALGSGGVLVELLDDVVLRLPPLTRQQAREMIRATRAWPLLQGYRGSPPADVDALAQLLVNLGRLALEQAGRLSSLDLNPVMVLPQGVVAVDVRIAMPAGDSQSQEAL